eukprot:6858121-Prymnesium_polylepis.1
MARTKQTARPLTEGDAPRRQLARMAMAPDRLPKRARVNNSEKRERFAKLQRVSALPSQMPDVDTVEGALHRIRLVCAVVMSSVMSLLNNVRDNVIFVDHPDPMSQASSGEKGGSVFLHMANLRTCRVVVVTPPPALVGGDRDL